MTDLTVSLSCFRLNNRDCPDMATLCQAKILGSSVSCYTPEPTALVPQPLLGGGWRCCPESLFDV